MDALIEKSAPKEAEPDSHALVVDFPGVVSDVEPFFFFFFFFFFVIVWVGVVVVPAVVREGDSERREGRVVDDEELRAVREELQREPPCPGVVIGDSKYA